MHAKHKQPLFIRDVEHITKTAHVLLYLLATQSLYQDMTAHKSLRTAINPEAGTYFRQQKLERTIQRLQQQGWLKTEYKEAKQIIKLTSKGELEALFTAAHSEPKPARWDGAWRLVMFDIPENANSVRRRLRYILHSFGYVCLQASIYIYPYPLNGEAITLFKKSGLMRYIRIARAEFDDDTDLRKIFNLRS